MKRLTIKGAYNYLYNNYGSVRHDMTAMVSACRDLSKQLQCKPLEMFHFIVEQEPIPTIYTHSYGFNTSTGREIRSQFETLYYEYLGE